MSYSLGSDNHSGVHPAIWKACEEAGRGHAHSYGMDAVCESAKAEWKRVLGREAEVFYVFNGTAANVLSIQAFVAPFEAVICSEQAHLHLDECGAPEKHVGCKLYALSSKNGKICPEQTKPLLLRGGDQHFSSPRLVTLTLPSELGVCYSLKELAEWRDFAGRHRLFVHWDGARLVNAAAFHNCSIAELIEAGRPDVISFGGTKNGLLGAEAVVLFDRERAQPFKFIRKQGLQLSSKTRFLAAQFQAFLKNDLWRETAIHVTNEARFLAERLREFSEIQIAFPVESNALFVRLPKAWIDPLKKECFFYIWDAEKGMARWMISFDWTRAQTERWLNKIREVRKQWPA